MEYDTIDNVTGNTQNAPMPYFAKDFRQIAWNALGERNQVWRFVAGMIILSVILGISIFAAQAFLELLHKISGSSQSYSNFAELVNDPFFWRAIVPVSILLATGCTYMIGFVAWAYSKMVSY